MVPFCGYLLHFLGFFLAAPLQSRQWLWVGKEWKPTEFIQGEDLRGVWKECLKGCWRVTHLPGFGVSQHL